MKIIRSTKCSLKFTTNSKMVQLREILSEYGKVVNMFIDYFWKNGTVSKSKLLKEIINIPKTWLSARLRAIASREALDMVKSVQEVFDSNKKQLYLSLVSIEKKIKKTKPNNRKKRRKLNNLYCSLKKKQNRLNMIHLLTLSIDNLTSFPICSPVEREARALIPVSIPIKDFTSFLGPVSISKQNCIYLSVIIYELILLPFELRSLKCL